MKILILPQFGIGDTLLSTPAIYYLKKFIERAEITAITMFKSTRDVLLNNPHIDELVYFPFLEKNFIDVFKFIMKIRGKFDVSINFYPSNRAHYNLLAWFSGAPKRMGHRYNNLDYRCLNFLKNITLKEEPSLHVVEENLRLVHLLGGPEPEPKDYKLLYFIREEEKEEALRKMEREGIGAKNLFGFHPGSSVYKNHIYKRWSREKFVQLIDLILDEFSDTNILLFGGKEDEEVKEFIKANVKRGDLVFNIRTKTVRETASIMSYCKIFITNDSGLMHLAASLNIPIVAIFGPTNPIWVGPWGVPHRIVRTGIDCSPCFVYSPRPIRCVKKRDFECMRGISVEMVLNAFKDLLREIK
jgi:heptosyltransferase-2